MKPVPVTIFQRRDGAYIVVPRGTALHALPAAATDPFMGADCTEKRRDLTPGEDLLGLDVRAALKDLAATGYHIAEPYIYESGEP